MSNVITAKVFCHRKTESGEDAERRASVEFYADYADGRNQEWAVNTPTLNLSMILNGRAADLFEQGGRYELRFVKEGGE